MLFTNIVHRLDPAEPNRRALDFQWAEARRLGLPTTTLLTYPTLFDGAILDQAGQWCGPGDELGIHLHEAGCPRLLEKYGVRERVSPGGATVCHWHDELRKAGVTGKNPWRIRPIQGQLELLRPDASHLHTPPLDANGRPAGEPTIGATISFAPGVAYYLIEAKEDSRN